MILSTVWRLLVCAKHRLLVSGVALGLGILTGISIVSSGIDRVPKAEYSHLTEFTLTSILFNNAVIVIVLVVGGIAFLGFATIGLLYINGFIIGVSVLGSTKGTTLLTSVMWIVPHGMFEIAGFIIASAAGLKFPLDIIRYLRREQTVTIEYSDIRDAGVLTATALVLILIGAVIEVIATPAIVRSI